MLSGKKLGGVLAAGAMVLALALTALSQQGRPQGPPPGGFHGGPGGPHGPGPRGGGIPFARELDLTDEQRAQIEKLTQGFHEGTKSLHEQMRALHENGGGDPLAGGAFDEAAVRKAAQERAAIQVELEVAHARLMSQLAGVLTPEQKARLAERRQQFEQRRREHGRPGAGAHGEVQ